MRTAELNYLESYEKFFILYNSLSAKEYKMAIQYLWLFQKLNASSIASSQMEMGTPHQILSDMSNQSNEQHNVFRFFTKSSQSSIAESQTGALQRAEHTMHLKAMLTIYLANS